MASDLFRGQCLRPEDARQRIRLLVTEVERSGDFEIVANLPLHWHRCRVDKLSELRGLLVVAKLSSHSNFVDCNVGRTERGPEVIRIASEKLGGSSRTSQMTAREGPVTRSGADHRSDKVSCAECGQHVG